MPQTALIESIDNYKAAFSSMTVSFESNVIPSLDSNNPLH
jgi:hypothetical protein